MTEVSTKLSLPYLQAAQAQKHITHNAALELLDLVVQLTVQSFSETTPPLSPDEGQTWALGESATGDWAGHDGELAAWANGGWLFIVPKTGWRASLGSDLRVFDGAAWVTADLPLLQDLPGVGVNTSYDATNKLSVASEAVLFTNIGDDMQLKVNKAAAGDTASLLFQTGFSGRAEMGTMGDDNFGVKVSPDGSAWSTAFSINATTGLSTLAGLTLTAPLSPASGGTGVANNAAATLTRSGNHALTLATTATTSLTLPTAGILATRDDAGPAILYDTAGNPNHMFRVPMFMLEDIMPGGELGYGPHPAFVVDGILRSEIYIGRYLASLISGTAVSLPGIDPAASISWTNASAACLAKGPGWHMMTNAEWAALALWSWKQGTMPRGNTNYGRDYVETSETGIRQDGLDPGVASGTARTLTASGPAGWNHNHRLTGIGDLTGNVWEWNRGLRLVDGEIQVIPDNDAAMNIDHDATSALWRAILEDGSLVAPGTTDTLKWDASGATGTGSPVLATTVASQSDGSTSANQQYRALTAPGLTVPPVLRALGLFPHDTDAAVMARGRFYMRNLGERMPIRGGSWVIAGNAGVFALSADNVRGGTGASVGFRPAFVI